MAKPIHTRNGSIPATETNDERGAFHMGALHGWVKCSDGRIYHPVITDFAMRAWAKKLKTRAKIDRRLQMESGLWADIRAQVFKRDKFTCQYCGATGARLECDHIKPMSKGGDTSLENLITACLPCNRSKGAKNLGEWRQ